MRGYGVKTDLVRASRLTFGPSTFVPQHTHELDAFIVHLTGSCKEKTGPKDVPRRSPEVVFLPARHTHSVLYSPAGAEVVVIELRKRLFQLQPPSPRTPLAERDGPLMRLGHVLVAAMERPESSTPAFVEAVVMAMYAVVCRSSTPAEQSMPPWLHLALDLIRDASPMPIPVASLSAAVDVHPSHLARTFRRFLRCGPLEYQRRLRLEKSRELLERTDLALPEIAATTGFYDQSHFIRAFSREFGVTPSAFIAMSGTLRKRRP